MKNRYPTLFLSLLIFLLGLPLQATIIYESGSLLEFVGGSAPGSEYDNYVSHVSEGIASPGYNDYGPNWLDVQTDGFGQYRLIPHDSPTLQHWRSIFEELLNNNTAQVDQMLQDSVSSFNYDLVVFTDTLYSRTLYMIRERLDDSFVDTNQPITPLDDVVGSFRNGWGLFILNPEASRRQVLIELPHPCDDFISPYIGTEMFLQTDALAMMISGAGREVVWTGSGSYTNNKSLSDPARNSNTVFHVYHQVLCDRLMEEGPHSPLVLHTHSFDDNEAHEGFQSIVLSGGYDAGNANKPIRDLSDENLDFVNFTTEYPIQASQFGEHDQLRVDDFYRVHYNGEFLYHGAAADYEMPHTYTLLGPNTGVQMNYLRQFFNNNSVYEPWVQVEMFEKPLLFQDMEMDNTELYAGDYPTSYHNFSILLEYYQPFIDAVQAYLINWESVPDHTPPDSIHNWQSTFDGQTYVNLSWEPVFDTNHKTYRIYYDTESIDEFSPFLDATTAAPLINPSTSNFVFGNLDPDENYVFQIQALDHFDNVGPRSTVISDSLPGHDPLTILENFDNADVFFHSYSDEDIHPDAWEFDDEWTFMNSAHSLRMWGNTWKVQEIEPYPVNDGTIFQVACYVEHLGEIQGLAFQDSLNTLYYALDGTQELDIEEWVTVYQGYFPQDAWNLIRMPVGDDWFARFDYYPNIRNIIYINDRDTDPQAEVFFDELFDITNGISFSPEVSIQYSQGAIYRDSRHHRSVDIDFTSFVDDADSEVHSYFWNFGDGFTSDLPNPSHTFDIEDDHEYSVTLLVHDESQNWGLGRVDITVDAGESSFPLTLNFVGDIMIARRYEDEGGIIATGGVESIFEPTLEVLGGAADLTIANLECPMTVEGEAHPTKSIIFKGHPSYVAPMAEAGIDIVSLANNHTIDYGIVGLQTTQEALAASNILYSGAGLNSDEAYAPIFTNTKGVNIAWLANSDRTGQYNNYQPYLNAGYNKPGFAYLTPYYLLQQINAVRDVSDLVVMEMHAGSEYSYEPGAGYDYYEFGTGVAPEDWVPPRENTENMDLPEDSAEDENYSPLLDVPHMWDREIRHFAIDSGADLVVVHHPHIIQGVEAYNGKLIAHSLGDFVFDLNYHETFPSFILNAEVDASGFTAYSMTPIYIDDYIPVPATGELANYILEYVAKKSRDLDTYVYVDKNEAHAGVWLDTLSMPRTDVDHRYPLLLEYDAPHWISRPMEMNIFGSASELLAPTALNWEYRLGRELLWYGNMEDEGSTQWNLNSSDEWYDVTEAYRGERSIGQHRTPNSGDNVITNLENRIRINSDKKHHVTAYIKTQNSSNANVQIRYYAGRTSSTILATHELVPNGGVNGSTSWTKYENDTQPPSAATYFDIRLNTDMPIMGDGYSWFDDVHFIEWADWTPAQNTEFPAPNDYYFIQLRSSIAIEDPMVQFTETVFNEVEDVNPDFSADETVILLGETIQFEDLSQGPVGWWEWDFGDGETSIEQHPDHLYTNPGFYTVTLNVHDTQGNVISESKPSFIRAFSEYMGGDLNFDSQTNVSDVIVLVSIIIGETEASDAQHETGDLNGDGAMNIQDLILLVNLILGE